MNHYGEQLKDYIKNKKVQQKVVADAIGVTQPGLSYWIQSDFPSLEGLHKITQYFGDPIWQPLISESDQLMPRPDYLKPEYEAVLQALDALDLDTRMHIMTAFKEILIAMAKEEVG